MIYHYKGFSYSILDKEIIIYDTRGVAVDKIKIDNKKNHLKAHNKIDNLVDKKPKTMIGLFETEPYHWDVYYRGKVYLGNVRQTLGDAYQCFEDNYNGIITKDIHGVMEYFRGVAKEKGLND